MQKYLNECHGVPMMENPPSPPSKFNFSPEELALIEELASYFFVPKEIVVMLELNESDAERAMENKHFYNAFQKGRLQSEMELRKSIIKLAKSGSSPAQTMSLDLLGKSKLKMLDR